MIDMEEILDTVIFSKFKKFNLFKTIQKFIIFIKIVVLIQCR